MRILHVTDSYRPATGGLERSIAAMAAATGHDGHEVGVVTLGRPDAPTDERHDGIRIRRLDGWSRHLRRLAHDDSMLFHPTVPDPALIRQLQAIIDDERPDIVHAHGWMVHSALSLQLPTGSALVVTLHDYGLHCAKKSLTRYDRLDQQCPGASLRRCLPCARDHYGTIKGTALVLGLAESRRRLDRVHMFLPISQAVARASVGDVDPVRVRIVPSFVPDDLLSDDEVTARPDFLPPGEFILFVGAMSRHKGVDTLVAAHHLLNGPGRVPLVLLGPAHSDVGDVGADVVVHAAVSNADVMAALRAATVAVVPSRWPEPLGLVAVEAMTAGTPVVASDVAGLAELVSGAGVLVPPGDAEALATALDALLGDPARRDQLRQAGRLRAREWTESAVFPRLLDAYAAARVNAGARPTAAPATGGRP